MNKQHLGLKLLVGFLGFLIIAGITILLYGVISGKKPFAGTAIANNSPAPTPSGAAFFVNHSSQNMKLDNISVQPNFIAITERGNNEHKITIINPLNGALIGEVMIKP